ncbi:MAG: hypothetical protein D6768_10080 [Chloroflexi bacterium]|nr:MAG: hypothetical protein D6768_10080 [Chloroflexota bacterium]
MINNGRFNTAKKIAYLLLVLWVCGVGPLMYFERFSSHQIVQKTQPLVLGYTVGHSPHLPAELLAALGRTPGPQPGLAHGSRAIQQPALVPVNSMPQFYLSVFKDGHMFAVAVVPFLMVALAAAVISTLNIRGKSAELPPPDRPPTFLFRRVLA